MNLNRQALRPLLVKSASQWAIIIAVFVADPENCFLDGDQSCRERKESSRHLHQEPPSGAKIAETGNAAFFYSRAFSNFFDAGAEKLAELEAVERWLAGPIGDIPLDAARRYLEKKSLALVDITSGTRCSCCKWDDLDASTISSHSLEIRAIVRAIALQARCDVVTNQSANAEDAIRTGMAFLHDLSTGYGMMAPSIAEQSVGWFLDTVRKSQAAASEANFYWVFAATKKPFVDVRNWYATKSLIFLENHVGSIDPSIAEAIRAGTVLPAERIEEFHRRIDEILLAQMGKVHRSKIAYTVKQGVVDATSGLEKMGFMRDQLNAMTDFQIVLAYEWRRLLRAESQMTRWLDLPVVACYRQFAKAADEFADALKRFDLILSGGEFSDAGVEDFDLFGQWLSAVEVDRRIAFLQTMEAIRHEAAVENMGAFPQDIADLKWPAPLDPITQSPFSYSCSEDGRGFRLTAEEIELNGKSARKLEANYPADPK